METRKKVFGFMVALGVTLLLAYSLPLYFENTLSMPAIFSIAVAAGFFVRESIQKDMALPKRALVSLAVGVLLYLIFLLIY